MPQVYQSPRLKTRLFGAGLAALLCGQPARAHDGHVHPENIEKAPRGGSASDALEPVAVAREGALTIYLDRVKTNEPVTDATIEAAMPPGSAQAAARPDGTFRLDAPWSRAPGSCDLTFAV